MSKQQRALKTPMNPSKQTDNHTLAAATLAPKDFAYGYDGLNQLTEANRGRLQDAPSPQLVAGSTNLQQAWSLDLAGNGRAGSRRNK